MRMGNIPLLDSDKERMRECLEDKVDFDDAVNVLINICKIRWYNHLLALLLYNKGFR